MFLPIKRARTMAEQTDKMEFGSAIGADKLDETPSRLAMPMPMPDASSLQQTGEPGGYKLPRPIVQEHEYLYAAVLELQRLRASVEALAAAVIASTVQTHEVELREPVKMPKPKRGEP